MVNPPFPTAWPAGSLSPWGPFLSLPWGLSTEARWLHTLMHVVSLWKYDAYNHAQIYYFVKRFLFTFGLLNISWLKSLKLVFYRPSETLKNPLPLWKDLTMSIAKVLNISLASVGRHMVKQKWGRGDHRKGKIQANRLWIGHMGHNKHPDWQCLLCAFFSAIFIGIQGTSLACISYFLPC